MPKRSANIQAEAIKSKGTWASSHHLLSHGFISEQAVVSYKRNITPTISGVEYETVYNSGNFAERSVSALEGDNNALLHFHLISFMVLILLHSGKTK